MEKQKYNLVKNTEQKRLSQQLGVSEQRTKQVFDYLGTLLSEETIKDKPFPSSQLIEDTLNGLEIEKLEEIILVAYIVGASVNPILKKNNLINTRRNRDK